MYSLVMPIRPRGSRAKKLTFDLRGGRDGVLDGADDVGRRVDAVNLADRHLEAFAEQQHGLPAAAHARQELAEIAQRVEHRQRPLLTLEIAHADRRRRIGDVGARLDFVLLPVRAA